MQGAQTSELELPGVGRFLPADGLIVLEKTSDAAFQRDQDGVVTILSTADRKVEFVGFKDRTLAYVRSAMGYPAYYPVPNAEICLPIQAVLMDLDGTSVHSEEFWIWIIQLTTASLLDRPQFELEEADLPHVSGHSVSEHLQYCIDKYCPERSVEEARQFYFEHTHFQMGEIMEGRGRKDAFRPAPGLKNFLMTLKDEGIRIGLVTSGLYEKAWPEILSAFRTLKMGNPLEFYDAVITAGFPMRKGSSVGTLGELSPKPHPWLYSEISRVGLGIRHEDRHHVIGLEDSGAGVCSIRLAGFTAIGMTGGNILGSGTQALCSHFCEDFEEVLNVIHNTSDERE